MGSSKADLFSASQQRCAAMMKALSHPARIAILEHLRDANACICGDLVLELPLSQPTISQHLRELKQAGLIKGTVEGKTTCYCIDHDGVRQLRVYLDDLTTNSTPHNNCTP